MGRAIKLALTFGATVFLRNDPRDSAMLEMVSDENFALDFDAFTFWDFLDMPCDLSLVPSFIFWIQKLDEVCIDGLRAWWEAPYPSSFKAKVTKILMTEATSLEIFYCLVDIVRPEILRLVCKVIAPEYRYDDLITAGIPLADIDIPDNWGNQIGPMIDKEASIKDGICHSAFGAAMVDLPDMDGIYAVPGETEGPDIFSPGITWEPIKGTMYNVLGCYDVVLVCRDGAVLPFFSDAPFKGLVKARYIGQNTFKKGE